REGTPATRLPATDFIPDLVAQERLERLIDLARGVQSDVNASEVGRCEEVLVEREGRYPGEVMGRTRRAKAVAFRGDASWVGTYRGVRLDSTSGPTFAGTAAET